ncbi:MAG: hypothetical protein A3G25_19935 [Betaproteobacteria bacterium RIFCSPLOWO2_12_FULL_63_13]|nr:MAG: hypothetical protein A3G25_19935 [Betaproteobacteria bacterium RIFCSPLOWO2_12_FULL_63_13]
MLTTPDKAAGVLRRLPVELQAPSLHPDYLLADAERSSALLPCFFVHEEGGESYYHAFHTEPVPGTDFIDVQSAYGYGGPVASSTGREFLQAVSVAWRAWCQENSVLAEFIRFHPLLENWRFFAGDVLDDRATVWVDLVVPDMMAQYTTRVRTAIRKAVKTGLRVEWWDAAEFLAVFPALYANTMRAIGAEDGYFFPRAYFKHLLANVTDDAPWLAICRDDRQILAGAIFLPGAELVEYHLSAANVEGKSRGATNLILHEAALRGQQAGKRRLHLGGGNNAAPDNPLLFFKAGFSPLRARFRIGRQIHDPQAYAALKADWDRRKGASGNRILFYR